MAFQEACPDVTAPVMCRGLALLRWVVQWHAILNVDGQVTANDAGSPTDHPPCPNPTTPRPIKPVPIREGRSFLVIRN